MVLKWVHSGRIVLVIDSPWQICKTLKLGCFNLHPWSYVSWAPRIGIGGELHRYVVDSSLKNFINFSDFVSICTGDVMLHGFLIVG